MKTKSTNKANSKAPLRGDSGRLSPWAWIPSLYLAEGLPYVAVVTLAAIMYKRMGISNADITLYTGWLYLPWVIKPFWSPFVDLLKTKRWWIVTMQLLIGAGFAGVAFMIPVPFFFQATLAFFWLLAFSSATHDIAADGFYMLALDTNTQAKFVGIRSTFYRLATIFGQGILIILAGALESATGMEPLKININASPEYAQTTYCVQQPENIVPQEGELRFIVNEETIQISTNGISADSLQLFLNEIKLQNEENGFVAKEENINKKSDDAWWTNNISKPLGAWIKNNFGEKKAETQLSNSGKAGNIGIVSIRLSKNPEAGKNMILNTSLNNGDKSISIVSGERLVFDENNWNKPAYMIFQLDPKLESNTSAEFKAVSGNIPLSWSITFFALAGLFIFFFFYHKIFLPKPESDKPTVNVTAKSILKDFINTFVSFFKKPGIGKALFFILTFRFSEAQALAIVKLFLIDNQAAGGLGLTTGEMGLAYGTIGILALTIGGILGGYAASKGGLKKWILPMSLCVLLPTAVFIYLGYSQTTNFFIINACIFVEQFGYGFGFTAYMLYLMYFSDGEHKTSHYAICTGLMALGMMIPGMFAGWLQEQLGYNHFFIWVMICIIVPLVAISLLKIDPNYGKATPKSH